MPLFEDTDHILDQILSRRADPIALPVVTDDYKWALKWARRIKKLTDTPIVFGKVRPTFHPAGVLRQDGVDFIIRGEGELTLLELVEVLDGKRRLENILGLGFKENGDPKINAMQPLIEDLDTLPFHDKNLYHEAMPYLNFGYTTMTGRGCPYRCTFCDNNTSAKLYKENIRKTLRWTRRHSPEYVVKEILWAKEKYGIKHVRFNDEDFSYDKRWICEIATLLAESGCDTVEMGIQSGAEHLRKEVPHRNTKDTQITEAMQALREAGIRTTVDIIIGLPTETKEDLDATARLLSAARPWQLYAFWLRYYPSAEILSIAKEHNLLAPEQIAKLENGEHTRGQIAGGTALEQDKISRSYHAFIVLLPLMPRFIILFFLNRNPIQFIPIFFSPFLMVNITKMIKRDRFNEFRVRRWRMFRAESLNLVKRALLRLILNLPKNLWPRNRPLSLGPNSNLLRKAKSVTNDENQLHFSNFDFLGLSHHVGPRGPRRKSGASRSTHWHRRISVLSGYSRRAPAKICAFD